MAADGQDAAAGAPIEELPAQDDGKIAELLRVVYPDHPLYRDMETVRRFIRWWFREPPGKAGRVFGVPGDGCVAGIRPLSFFPFLVEGKEELGGLLNSTVTHPDYRKRGFFSRSLRRVLDVAGAEERLRFAISFPNDNSYPLHLKNPRMAALVDIPLWARVLDGWRAGAGKRLHVRAAAAGLRLAQWRPHRRPPDDVTLDEVRAFDGRFDALLERTRGMNGIWIARSSAYLGWRYGRSPLGSYATLAAADRGDRALRGYVVTKVEERFGLRLGLVVDLVALPGDGAVAAALVSAGLARLARDGASVAGCLMLAHHPLARALAASGMLRVPARVAPRAFHVTVARLTHDLRFNGFLLNPASWFITWGDTDTV